MKILLLNTGGTIGMVQTFDGFAPLKGTIEAALDSLRTQNRIAADVQVVNFDPLIDASQATPHHWAAIAGKVFAGLSDYDGFVVVHGTDTLAYSAAALCLLLTGLGKPVVVTGSMLPLSVPGSDGWANLADAVGAAGRAAPGVWVQFAGRLLHGARVRKSHSSALDAFEADPTDALPLCAGAEPALASLTDHRVGVFSITPGPCVDVLRHVVQTCDGVVLRCYGSGTAPDTPDMDAALRMAWTREVPVLAVSQCPEGGLKLGTYAAGRVMRDNGVIDGRETTVEMAYAKVHVALSRSDDFETRRAFLSRSQCGEFTE